MASTYALPVSAMPHSHGHGHVHSNSHTRSFSPSKLGPGGQKTANTSRAPRQERSNGGLHSHAYSEFSGSNQERTQNSELVRTNISLPLQTENNNFTLGGVYGEQRPYEFPPAYSQPDGYEADQAPASKIQHDHGDHDHSHHDHAHHDHATHSHSHGAAEKRSRFTRMILPYTEGWTLLHSIVKEKDSRRIFYFMRCVSQIALQISFTNNSAASISSL
jgi:zinc transporter 5/7